MCPRSEEANAQVKDDRRRQILLSALQVFVRKGFSATKMSDIATDAGISYGLLYHYFQSKNQIYAELVNSAVQASTHGIEQAQSAGTEPVEAIRSLVTSAFRAVDEQQFAGYSFVLWLGAMTSHGYTLPDAPYRDRFRRPLDQLVGVIEEGQRRGQIAQGDPRELAVTLLSALLGLASLKVGGALRTMPDPDVLMRLFRPAVQATT